MPLVWEVLILVVMEDTLCEVQANVNAPEQIVLILVVMEDTL